MKGSQLVDGYFKSKRLLDRTCREEEEARPTHYLNAGMMEPKFFSEQRP